MKSAVVSWSSWNNLVPVVRRQKLLQHCADNWLRLPVFNLQHNLQLSPQHNLRHSLNLARNQDLKPPIKLHNRQPV
jgi:hypothetical protein